MGGFHSGEDQSYKGENLTRFVYAIGNGKVVKISDLGALGKLVAIEHTGSFIIPGKKYTHPTTGKSYSYITENVSKIYSVYMHLTDLKVTEGEEVTRDTVLGSYMNPGGGYHLHFEIRHPNTKHSSNWSLFGAQDNWAMMDGKYTGYYKDLQKMVDDGTREPSSVIYANQNLTDGTPPAMDEHSDILSFDPGIIIPDNEVRFVDIPVEAIQQFLKDYGSVLKDIDLNIYQLDPERDGKSWSKHIGDAWSLDELKNDRPTIEKYSPAKIIYLSAKENNINPVILLAYLHKEQSLIEKGQSSFPDLQHILNRAVGYGMKESGDCPKYYGFLAQLTGLSYEIDSELPKFKGNYTRIIDGKEITIKSAFAHFHYDYTPHLQSARALFAIYNKYRSYFLNKGYSMCTGMVSYWKLNEGSGNTAKDSSGCKNDGTLKGNTNWVKGKSEYALEFDGNGDYVEVSHSSSLVSASFAIEAWVYLNADVGNTQKRIVSKQQTCPKSYSFELFGNGYGGSKGNQLNLAIGNGSTWVNFLSTTHLSTKTWYHIAGTHQGRTSKIYINGQLDKEGETTNQTTDNTAVLTIGCVKQTEPPEVNFFFNGIIDEVAIYNKDLTSKEIHQHYQNGLQCQ